MEGIILPLLILGGLYLVYRWAVNKGSRVPILWVIASSFFPPTLILLFFIKPSGISVHEYREENPDLCTGNGIACKHCGSRSIRAIGIASIEDLRKHHHCNSCGEVLYRSGF